MSLKHATMSWHRTWVSDWKFAIQWPILNSTRKEFACFPRVLISQKIAKELLIGCGEISEYKVSFYSILFGGGGGGVAFPSKNGRDARRRA